MVAPRNVAPEIHLALQALQHRGQDSAGIATMTADGTRFPTRRGLGTAAQALGPQDLEATEGPVGIGHVRYPTVGKGVLEDAQPFFYRQPGVLMAHNGNVINYGELREGLLNRSIHLLSQCDIEPALCEFSDALNRRRAAGHTMDDALDAAGEMMQRVRGSYSIAAGFMLEGKPTLMVARDPHGIRPATIGRRSDGAWMASSETVAFDALGFEREFEPEPGEVVFLRQGEPPVRHSLGQKSESPCLFEFVYFARPDSVMHGRSVYEVRLALGRQLGERIQEKGIEADVVVPVPDTARPAAATLAETTGLPVREGLIKNRYSGRTFIMPDQLTRNSALRLKLNTLPREIRGQRVLLVDDSIVRGTTLRRVIELLRDAQATEVHLAIHSPPVRNPCFYGIDMSTEEELFARRFDAPIDQLEQQAARTLDADSLTYLTVDRANAAFGSESRCAACFDGVYPEPVGTRERSEIAGDRRERT
jgi:amidophosphoribosyltransferase